MLGTDELCLVLAELRDKSCADARAVCWRWYRIIMDMSWASRCDDDYLWRLRSVPAMTAKMAFRSRYYRRAAAAILDGDTLEGVRATIGNYRDLTTRGVEHPQIEIIIGECVRRNVMRFSKGILDREISSAHHPDYIISALEDVRRSLTPRQDMPARISWWQYISLIIVLGAIMLMW